MICTVFRYAIGSVYDTEDCEQCICSLGGTPQCAQKICPTCNEVGFTVLSVPIEG